MNERTPREAASTSARRRATGVHLESGRWAAVKSPFHSFFICRASVGTLARRAGAPRWANAPTLARTSLRNGCVAPSRPVRDPHRRRPGEVAVRLLDADVVIARFAGWRVGVGEAQLHVLLI